MIGSFSDKIAGNINCIFCQVDLSKTIAPAAAMQKRTHVRSRSDATGLLTTTCDMDPFPSLPAATAAFPAAAAASFNKHHHNLLQHKMSLFSPTAKPKLALGDLASGRAFDNGCSCFDPCKMAVNDLCGRKNCCEFRRIVFFPSLFLEILPFQRRISTTLRYT